MKIIKIQDSINYTYDIEVSEVHEYLLDNGIVSHNTSSDFSNSTSGIDMPRDLIVTKKTKLGNTKQIVPNFYRGSQYYTLATELDNIKYIKMLSKIQLYIDQAISANVYWTKKDFVKDKTGVIKFPMKLMVNSIIKAHKFGLKTTYYSTFIDENAIINGEEEAGCSDGGCSV